MLIKQKGTHTHAHILTHTHLHSFVFNVEIDIGIDFVVAASASHLQLSHSVIIYHVHRWHQPAGGDFFFCAKCCALSHSKKKKIMKKLIIPTLMDTYGLIKFWNFDDGMPDGPKQSGSSKRRTYFSHLPGNQMPSERRYKWRICLLQVTPNRPPGALLIVNQILISCGGVVSSLHIFMVPFSQLFNRFVVDNMLLWYGLYAHNFTPKLIYQFDCEMYRNTRKRKQNLDKKWMPE